MDENMELEKKLRAKRIKKYVFTVVALVILASVAISLKLSGKDSLVRDGLGNLPTAAAIEQDADSEKTKPTPREAAVDNSKDFTASNGGNKALKPKKAEPVTVTIEIRCDTLSSDLSKLDNESIREYIPEDGTVLATTTYKGTTDNTVYDALVYACRNNDIQFEASYTPMFESYYIEGIGYMYEFDGGPQSGWMYKVNDWFPNYGCSSYYLSDGDEIKWLYTCEGLGEDVGCVWMG